MTDVNDTKPREKVTHDWGRILLLLDVTSKLIGHPKYKWLLDEAGKELEELSISPEMKEKAEAERLAAEEATQQAEEAEQQRLAEEEALATSGRPIARPAPIPPRPPRPPELDPAPNTSDRRV